MALQAHQPPPKSKYLTIVSDFNNNDLRVCTNDTAVFNAFTGWYQEMTKRPIKLEKGTQFVQHIAVLDGARKLKALGTNNKGALVGDYWIPVADALMNLGCTVVSSGVGDPSLAQATQMHFVSAGN